MLYPHRGPWRKFFAPDEQSLPELVSGCIRLLSLGHFYRTELVRSFVRPGAEALPTVYEVRMSPEK